MAGSLEVDAPFASGVVERTHRAGLGERLSFVGPLRTADLADAYAAADLVVQPSRVETYGMSVADGLARGLPVLASAVGGLPRTLIGTDPGPGDRPPGILVPPGDAGALAWALRSWLDDRGLRDRLRAAALERRARLLPWSETVRGVADVLARVDHAPTGRARRRVSDGVEDRVVEGG